MTRKCCLERLQILINMLSYIKLYIYNIYGEILSYFAFPWGVNGPSDSCGPRQVNGVTALNVWLTAPNSYRPPRTHSPNPAFTQQTACHTIVITLWHIRHISPIHRFVVILETETLPDACTVADQVSQCFTTLFQIKYNQILRGPFGRPA